MIKIKLDPRNKKDYHILQVLYETTKLTIAELSNAFNISGQKIIKLKTNHHWFRTKERKLEYLNKPEMYKPLILKCIQAKVGDKFIEIVTNLKSDVDIVNKNELNLPSYRIVKDLYTGEYLGLSVDDLNDINFIYTIMQDKKS